MSEDIPEDLKYSEEHEWVRVEGGVVFVGITKFAVEELTDITYVEVEAVDDVEVGDVFGVVESTKTASDLYSPVSGEIIEDNEDLIDAPELLNEDPYKNWIVKIKPSNLEDDLEELMDAEEYEEYLDSLE